MLNSRTQRLLDFASCNSLRLFIGAVGFAAVFYCLYELCFGVAYAIGDWVINYSGGFVRRGFIGEFILLVARAVHLPPPWITVVVQIVIYLTFLLGVYRLAAPLRRTPLWYAIVFSPAGLAFMILDTFNGVRKEILAPVALTAVILLLRRRPPAFLLSLISAALFAVMVLSHDSLYCCLPYFFAAVALAAHDLKYAAKVMAAPFAVAALLLNAVRLHPGNESIAMTVCHSVGGRWLGTDDFRNLCSGGIAHLGWTISRSRQEELQNLHYWPLYAVLAVLSLAPYVIALIVLYKRDGLRFEVKVISWTAVLCALLSSLLFYLTIDWGRWINMQILCLLLLILMTAQHAASFLPEPNPRPFGEGQRWRRPLLIAVFLYCTCWTLPVLGMEDVRLGYLEVPHSLYAEFRVIHQVHGWQTIDRGW